MNDIVRFDFGEQRDRDGVEADACLAIFVSECIHGRPRTRLDVSYLVDAIGERCVLAVEGEAGETALSVFTGLCGERFGEHGFRIKRLPERELRR